MNMKKYDEIRGRQATLMVQRLSCNPLQRSSASKGLHRPGMTTSSSHALYMADAEEAKVCSFQSLLSQVRRRSVEPTQLAL